MITALFFFVLNISPAFSAVDSTWSQTENLNTVLTEMVTTRVKADLSDGAPWFEFDKLEQYVSNPKTLPERLNGKANDALWTYVPVLVAEGKPQLALGLVEMLRNPNANLNPKVVYHGILTYAELLRQTGASEKVVKAVLAELPAKVFFSKTATFATLISANEQEAGKPLPNMYQSSLDNMMTYPMTPDSASGYLQINGISKGIWQNIGMYQKIYDELYTKAKAAKAKPYHFATVNMEDYADKANPVVIGIFDSGVAPMRYNMYEKPGEYINGLDDDGNGLIDDISGVVWDWDPNTRHQHSNLDQVEKLPPNLVEEYERYIIGAFDRRAGIESEEAKAFNDKLTSLASVEEQKDFSINMGKIGEFSHGTHVAGLASAGNRWAQMASFRFSWTGEGRIYHERGPSDQELRWERESIHEMIKWVNENNIRVVNASLGFTVEYQEAALSKERDVFQPDLPAYGKIDENGKLTPELDQDRIKARAEKIQEFRREIWKELFDGCPNTLFVLAAGNDDHDIREFMDVPTTSPVEHNNLLIIGAVDSEGDWASFTNFNQDLVKVYDFGVNVMSYSPTGRMIPMSGTSMAAPNATNTAGKLFSLYPDLTPSQVKVLMIETATPLKKPFNGGIVNEPAAVEEASKLVQ